MNWTEIKYKLKRIVISNEIIARFDEDKNLRLRAIQDLTDLDLLSVISECDRDIDVRQKAFKKIPPETQAEILPKLIENYSGGLEIHIDKRKVIKEYSKAIVTFIDILGFRDMVNKNECNYINRSLECTQHYSKTPDLKYAFKVDKDNEYIKTYVVNFSDTVVRVTKFKRDDYEEYKFGALYDEIEHLVNLQASLLDFKILSRGGVTIGDVYIDKNTVFGPALIDAYDIESKLAKYPRIVISPVVMNEILIKFENIDCFSISTDLYNILTCGEILKFLHKMGDDYYFPDYLGCSIDPTYPQEIGLLWSLKRFSEILSEIYKENKNNKNAMVNIRWLVDYHHEIVSNLNEEVFKKNFYKKDEFFVSI